MVPLSDIAEARIGHTFRTGVAASPAGSVTVVQSKDMAPDDRAEPDAPVRAEVGRVDQWLFTKVGDVLFQPRGTRFPAMAVPVALLGAVVASPLYLLRPRPDRVDAAYLAAIINTPAVQAALRARAEGSYIPQVSAETIRSLALPLPPLGEQRAIAALASLVREEARIVAALAAQRSVWLHALAVHRQGGGPKRNSRRHANAPG